MAQVKKQGRDRSRTYDSYEYIPEFFKVFIMCRNYQQLKIPTAFVMECAEVVEKNTKLKGRDGKLWPVVVEKTDGGVFFKKGWVNFVDNYAIKNGEFLVFKYIGDSTFLVKVFGSDGCKVEASPTQIISAQVKVKDEPQETQPKKPFTKPSSSKQPRGRKKSQKVPSQLVRQESDEIQEPEDPYFIAPLNLKQKYTLTIPREIASLRKLREEPEMMLRNEEGKKWPVNVYKCTDGRMMFGRGWLNFRKGNGLRDSDSCKFTFLKGGSSKVIQVKTLRGN